MRGGCQYEALSHTAIFIFRHLLLVPSCIRFREGLQVRPLTAEGLPRVRIRIVKEYAHQFGTENDAYGMLLCTEHIVVTSNRPNAPK